MVSRSCLHLYTLIIGADGRSQIPEDRFKIPEDRFKIPEDRFKIGLRSV